jgi:hypothetical protein
MSVDPEHTEQPGEVGPDEATPDESEQPAESPEQGEEEEASESEGEPAEAEPSGEAPSSEAPVAATKTDAEWEKIGKSLDTRATTYRNAVSTLMGESAQDLVPCELCTPPFIGFHFPAASEQPRSDLHARLLAVLQRPTAVDIKQDPNTRACPTCEGLGELLTGSNVPGNERHKCPDCSGYGFVPPPGSAAPTNGAADTRLAPVGEHVAPLITDDTDAWGEPKLLPDGRENPNYGKMPQFKIQVPPWGTTANLTPADAVPAE